MLYHLIYVSSAVTPMDDQGLAEILKVSRRNNSAEEISGMLLYKDGIFMQVLEGEEEQVKQRYQIISNDSRHEDLMVLSEKPLSSREFPNWTMGFKHMHQLDEETRSGYSDFLDQDGLRSPRFGEQPDRAHRLLLSFRDHG